MTEHLGTGIEQEEAEEAEHPLETLYHSSTGEDEDATQDEGTEDAPEEYLMLVFALYTEEREEHEEYEEIVHRQGLLDEVSCKKLYRHLVRITDWIPLVDACCEEKRDANPDGCHLQGFPDTDFVLTFLAKHLEVNNQHDEDQHIK